VARRFADRRVFLAGDAAHLMPPNGGFGGNTGIHDGHNLAWKLAFVLKGIAGPALLDTYEAERHPAAKFTVEQAYTRYVTRSATYLGAKDFQPLASDFNIELGYLYRSPAVVAEDHLDRGHEDPRESFGRPGSRAPHLWIQHGGKKISTLDLYGRAFVLLTPSEGEAWVPAAQAAAQEIGRLELDTHIIEDERFAAAYGLSEDGATLIRPDGFVAWRSKTIQNDLESAVKAALRSVLLRS
jgi:hypothetical protein